jgi:hypothetical protein
MNFIPRTCVGVPCRRHSLPIYYGTEDCSCVDESDVASWDFKELLSADCRILDGGEEGVEGAVNFIGPLSNGAGLRQTPEEIVDNLRREEKALDLQILRTTSWMSELFTMLEENELIHWWPCAIPQNQSLSSQLSKILSSVQKHQSLELEEWRNISPKRDLLEKLRNPNFRDHVVYTGQWNPLTGGKLHPGETWASAVEKEWRECCFKRAYVRIHLELLEETEEIIRDTIGQETIAACLEDIQTILERKMDRDNPDVEEQHVYFQTAMATLILQWELNFRKESLRLDMGHLMSRLDNIQDRASDIRFYGELENVLKDDTIQCCGVLNNAKGCGPSEKLTAAEESRLLDGIVDFTATQQLGLLQNGLRRTLILEEIFQRLSTQILHKMFSNPRLKHAELIPFDFDLEQYMKKHMPAGESIRKCRNVLAILSGRSSPTFFGSTLTSSQKMFPRL